MALFDTIRAGASGTVSEFTIDRSLRSNGDDGAYLEATQRIDVDSTNNKIWTYSVWIKRTKLSGDQAILVGFTNTGSFDQIIFSSSGGRDNQFFMQFNNSGTYGQFTSDRVFRDVGAWGQLVLKADTTASSNGITVYWNNEEVTGTWNVTLAQNATFHSINQAGDIFRIGRLDGGVANHYNYAYFAEATFVDGQALNPSSFAETDATTGQWKPIDTSGLTFGHMGFRLKFADNSNNAALGTDSSGNGNNFSVYNLSSSHDTVIDTPTNNFCTLNELNQTTNATLSDGNLILTNASNDQASTGTFGITSGKWYWEMYKKSTENPEVGIDSITADSLSHQSTGTTNTRVAFITNGGNLRNGAGGTASITGSSSGQTGAGVIAIAVDFDNKKIWFSDLSGNFFNSGNPATGSNAAFDFSSVDVANGAIPYVFIGTGAADSAFMNFGQDGAFAGAMTGSDEGTNTDGNGQGRFKYSVPSGFLALCSANLPDPTVLLPYQYFNTLLWTGNSVDNRDITGLSFQPDWVWIKQRSGTEWHNLVDAVRGSTKYLFTNETNSESTSSNKVQAFNSDGFELGTDGSVNSDTQPYVGWNWNAGGSTVTNNDGTISSQVRASTTAGFSVVTYTGAGGVSTIGHGLGVAPDMFIVKSRTQSSDWEMYWSILGNTSRLNLNSSSGASTGINGWNSTSPTSTVVTINGGTAGNTSGQSHVMYCFSNVASYSKFGKYTGNGSSSSGTFVFTGFRPAWVMLKRSDSSGGWIMFDNKRDPANAVDAYFTADANSSETSGTAVLDFLSNGFKFYNSWNAANQGTMVYLAFAESPFKNTRAR